VPRANRIKPVIGRRHPSRRPRVPGAAQRAVVRRRPGTTTSSEAERSLSATGGGPPFLAERTQFWRNEPNWQKLSEPPQLRGIFRAARPRVTASRGRAALLIHLSNSPRR
jgi:hypothetical protein